VLKFGCWKFKKWDFQVLKLVQVSCIGKYILFKKLCFSSRHSKSAKYVGIGGAGVGLESSIYFLHNV